MSNTTNATKNGGNTYDIHDRIYGFILRVIKLSESLPKTASNSVICKQLLRSATSIGANDQEADGTTTKRDFIHCYTVVKKEAKETNFWLKLIFDTNLPLQTKMKPLMKEGEEITAIISSILNNTRHKK
jgi:four helix bundle protein